MRRLRASLKGVISWKAMVDAHVLGGEGEPPDHPSCSQNAHAQKVLVRRAQSRINQAVPQDGNEQAWRELFQGRMVASLLGREGRSSQVPFRARGTPTMKLWSFDARSKGQPGYSL